MSRSKSPSPTPLDDNTYRSANTGARIWRRELLSRRRDEFADLPDGIRSVYVARVSRAIAGLMLALGGALIIALGTSPELAAWFESVAPGPRPAVMTTLLGITWGVGALFYLAGRAFAENRFTRAMLRAVKPTEDVHHDVQRLANVRPGAVATSMTRAWGMASTALPILAASALVPATVIYLAMAVAAGGYVSVTEYEAALADGSAWLATLAGLGVVAALLCGRLQSASRAHLGGLRTLFWSLSILGFAAALGGLQAGWPLLATLAGSTALVSSLGAWATGRLRRDHRIIFGDNGEEDDVATVASSADKLRAAFGKARLSIRERGLLGATGHALSAARARLALGRRLLGAVKAPLSWSLGTTMGVAAAVTLVVVAGQLGASSLADANAQTASATSNPTGQLPWHDLQPDGQQDPDEPSTVVLYTAAPDTAGQPGRLLVLNLDQGIFATTDLLIDLNYLPCGKMPADAVWKTGTVTRSDNALSLSSDFLPSDLDLDITAAGDEAPLELRSDDNTVYTPCMATTGLDIDDLVAAATGALPGPR